MKTALHVVLMLALVIGGALAPSASAETTIGLEVVAEGLTAPLVLTAPNDGTKRRFIVEQTGHIRILMPDGALEPEPFLNLQSKLVPLVDLFDERGLLGLAFHPDYKTNGRFFVYYSTPTRSDAPLRTRLHWNHTAHVSEFKVSKDDPNKANPISERILLQIDQPQFNHNGGNVAFGPDGYLYVSIGDGGYANDQAIGHPATGNAQDTTNLLGSIIRIDVNNGDPYAIPSDNPFVGSTDARQEIFAYGLRNAWRMSFDAGGQLGLIAADVGQNSWEEVNVVTKGGNYGWNRLEGTHCFDPDNPNEHPTQCSDQSNGAKLISPVLEYPNLKTRSEGIGISVTGGYVYRGSSISQLQGMYVFGDWSTQFRVPDGRLFMAKPASQAGAMWAMEELKVAGTPEGRIGAFVLSFGEDADRELYVLTSVITGPTGNRDVIYKIVPAQ
ncbi:MAG: PQQ-dependent sugar dehydrogenase [Candidatus Tectomicrobia bacterium]|nr:PQQ-dependent sugar dehydrogenase [Candidatus Tectomicrobia bacterium]